MASNMRAVVGRARWQILDTLPGRHRLVSKDSRNILSEAPNSRDDGAPEHADKRIQGDLASYFTMENVQDYMFTGHKPKEPVYALIVISSLHEGKGDTPRRTYMVGKVSLQPSENIPMIRNLIWKMAAVLVSSECKGKPNSTRDCRNDQRPSSTKKARWLGDTLTDESLPSSVRKLH